MKKTVYPSAISGKIEIPSSKSYMQRAVAAALIANGESEIFYNGICDDSLAAIEIAKALGAKIKQRKKSIIVNGGLNPLKDLINCHESGLSTRMFTPIAALSNKQITITGESSLLKRPIDMMENPLKELGVLVESNSGFLPISVKESLPNTIANSSCLILSDKEAKI